MFESNQPQQSTQTSLEAADPAKTHSLEIGWGVAVLEAFLTIARINSRMLKQLAKIKEDIKSNVPKESVVSSMNQFIGQLNSVLGGAPLPPFELTGPDNARRAVENYIVSFEKYVNFAMENNTLTLKDEFTVFNKAIQIWDGVISGQPPLKQSLSVFQGLINEVNTLLPEQNQFPNIPSELYGGKI
ncbi:MAG: hypothetical protein WAM28_07540 [Chlamydiales bacterium]